MELITEASEIPDEKYHTVTIEEEDDGMFSVSASNNETAAVATVGSIAIGGESAGLETGDMRLGAADQMMRLEYVDFTDEYGYEEIQVTFVERDR